MGQTIIEKILSSHSGQEARAGDIVVAELDYVMGQDGTAPLAIRALRIWAVKMHLTDRVALSSTTAPPAPTRCFRCTS